MSWARNRPSPAWLPPRPRCAPGLSSPVNPSRSHALASIEKEPFGGQSRSLFIGPVSGSEFNLALSRPNLWQDFQHLTEVLYHANMARPRHAHRQDLGKVDSAGRVLIPADARKELGMKPGTDVVLTIDEDEVRITTHELALRRAQEVVGRLVSQERSLADELIEERRAEARRG